MIKLVKRIALLCPIDDVNSRNLMEELELGIAEDLSGNVHFVLADPAYNERSYGKDDHAQYALLLLNNTKDIANVMKARAHQHVLCSSLEFLL